MRWRTGGERKSHENPVRIPPFSVSRSNVDVLFQSERLLADVVQFSMTNVFVWASAASDANILTNEFVLALMAKLQNPSFNLTNSF